VHEIKPDRLAHYRRHFAGSDIPVEKQDALIRTLATFLKSFIDHAFGTDPVQLATKDRLSKSFNLATEYDKVADGQEPERIDLTSEGATTPTQPRRDVRDGAYTNNQGGHLLPHI